MQEIVKMSEHVLTVYGAGLDAKGAKSVDGFSEKEVKVTLSDERRLTIFGENLKIAGFSQSTGELTVCGKIVTVSYRGKSENFLKKVFK